MSSQTPSQKVLFKMDTGYNEGRPYGHWNRDLVDSGETSPSVEVQPAEARPVGNIALIEAMQPISDAELPIAGPTRIETTPQVH